MPSFVLLNQNTTKRIFVHVLPSKSVIFRLRFLISEVHRETAKHWGI